MCVDCDFCPYASTDSPVVAGPLLVQCRAGAWRHPQYAGGADAPERPRPAGSSRLSRLVVQGPDQPIRANSRGAAGVGSRDRRRRRDVRAGSARLDRRHSPLELRQRAILRGRRRHHHEAPSRDAPPAASVLVVTRASLGRAGSFPDELCLSPSDEDLNCSRGPGHESSSMAERRCGMDGRDGPSLYATLSLIPRSYDVLLMMITTPSCCHSML